MSNLAYLTTGIYAKTTGSSLSSNTGGRIFKGIAPPGAEFPYVVFSVESATPDRTFTEVFEDTLIQFDIYSKTSGSTSQIETLYNNLNTIYDESTLSITGSTLMWMRRTNASLIPNREVTPMGEETIWHYSVMFECKTLAD